MLTPKKIQLYGLGVVKAHQEVYPPVKRVLTPPRPRGIPSPVKRFTPRSRFAYPPVKVYSPGQEVESWSHVSWHYFEVQTPKLQTPFSQLD